VTTLKCLSLRQPWAWAVVDGGKNIENRTWNTRVRGPILIHAAKGMTGAEYDVAMLFCKERGLELPNPKLLARGGIVGAARLIGVLPPERNTLSPFDWHMAEQHGFILAAVTPLPFREHRGALGFFSVVLSTPEKRILIGAGLL